MKKDIRVANKIFTILVSGEIEKGYKWKAHNIQLGLETGKQSFVLGFQIFALYAFIGVKLN